MFDYEDYIKAKLVGGVNVDTGFRCRLRCPACVRTQSIGTPLLRDSKDMTMEAWRKILAMNSVNVQLCGQISDPIYHPKFHELMQIRQDEYPHVPFRTYTNGSGKRNSWWDKVIELSHEKDEWVFGLDGASQEVANVYRVGTDFDNVYNVMKKLQKANLRVVWQFIVFEHNKHELPVAIKMAKENGIILKELWTSRDTPEVPAAKQDTATQNITYRY